MPYVGRRITIEVTNVLRSGTYIVEVLYRGSRESARRDFAHFLRRYHDPGKAYIVHYVSCYCDRRTPTSSRWASRSAGSSKTRNAPE
jgi:hypothetical protein